MIPLGSNNFEMNKILADHEYSALICFYNDFFFDILIKQTKTKYFDEIE